MGGPGGITAKVVDVTLASDPLVNCSAAVAANCEAIPRPGNAAMPCVSVVRVAAPVSTQLPAGVMLAVMATFAIVTLLLNASCRRTIGDGEKSCPDATLPPGCCTITIFAAGPGTPVAVTLRGARPAAVT